MTNYENSKIYRIWSPSTDKVYVGHTTKNHVCIRIRDDTPASNILKLNDSVIDLIEQYPCNSKNELLKRQRYWNNYYKIPSH
jgi:hypothetical protein